MRRPLLALTAQSAALAVPSAALAWPVPRLELLKKSAKPAATTQISFTAVGDIAMVAGPSSSYFDGVGRYLNGDVVLGNLEGTLTDRGDSKCGGPSGGNCFAFRAPPSYASLLRSSGFTIMNNANNHAMDFGSVGLSDTIAALERAGLRHTGRPGEIAVLRVKGVRIALVGFAPYSWAQSLTDLPGARSIVRRAAAKADVVVATMHAGGEGSDQMHVNPGSEYFLGENRGDVEAFAHTVVDAGADLVVGHGPHVLRGMEWYHGRLIAYSLGNFLGYQTLSSSGVLGLSGVLHATLRSDGSWVRGDLTPVHLVNGGIPARDPDEASHGLVRELSKTDFGRRAMRISFTGVLSPPR